MRKICLFFVVFAFYASLVMSQNNTRMTCYYDANDNKSYYIAWDIKTGESIQYYWNGSKHQWDAFEINLPAQPVPGATGNIMMDVYYDRRDNAAYYIAWDTKTGKSVQYSWNGTDHKWQAFEINLPENPLPGHTGEIMIKSYYSIDDAKAYYMVYDTNGGKSIQYYWNGTKHQWEAFEINLPEKPLQKK